MFTTGSKLLIGSAALAWVSALVYGVAQEGALGTIGLISVATALSLLAAINVFVRDSNVSALEPARAWLEEQALEREMGRRAPRLVRRRFRRDAVDDPQLVQLGARLEVARPGRRQRGQGRRFERRLDG